MWWWVLIWVVLVLCAVVYLGARLWTLWGQSKELGGELVPPRSGSRPCRASSTSSASASPAPEQLAVFADRTTAGANASAPATRWCRSDARAGSARTPRGSGT